MLTPPHLPRLDAGLATLTAQKDLILCDVWGVIHNGVRHHERAVDALCRFRRRGGTVILLTNAPAPQAQVRARLDGLGVSRDAFDRIATSGDVTVATLVAAGCPPVFNIGPSEDVAIYQEAARLGPRFPAQVAIESAALAICIGLDSTGERPEDYDAILRRLRARDLKLICANPDLVVEVGDRLVYCAGMVAERYAALGGTVVHAGKPFPAIYARALAMAEAIRGGPTAPSRILAVGDAVRTDIAGAADQGIDAVLITAGIHRARLHGTSGHSALDEAALAQFLGESAARPVAAMSALSWDL